MLMQVAHLMLQWTLHLLTFGVVPCTAGANAFKALRDLLPGLAAGLDYSPSTKGEQPGTTCAA